MPPRIDAHLLLMFLYTQLESLDDLTVLLWLGRQPNVCVDVATVASAVGIEEDQALEALKHFARVGLVEEHTETGGYRYALDYALPSALTQGLGGRYAANLPN